MTLASLFGVCCMLLITAGGFSEVAGSRVAHSPVCRTQADIVFLLDASGSVGSTNFRKMLKFVGDVSAGFRLGRRDVQVGVATFSSAFQTEVSLRYANNINSLRSALSRIRYRKGSTNTAGALLALTQRSFTRSQGHRSGVPKIAVVITDGRSDSMTATANYAKRARRAGIYLLAVGIGPKVNMRELKAIASNPDSRNVLTAHSYSALRALTPLLARRACPSPPRQPSLLCTKADVVFVLDSSKSMGPDNFRRALSFVQSLVQKWVIGSNHVRVGVMTFSDRIRVQLWLSSTSSKTSLLSSIERISYTPGNTNTGSALSYLRSTMFHSRYGDRSGVNNIAIIITDGKSNDQKQTARMAAAAQSAGITLFAVGVGSYVDSTELRAIATNPDSRHVFTVRNYRSLRYIQSLFQRQVCRG